MGILLIAIVCTATRQYLSMSEQITIFVSSLCVSFLLFLPLLFYHTVADEVYYFTLQYRAVRQLTLPQQEDL